MTAADAGGRPAGDRLPVPSLILAADHRARGVVTIERYARLPSARSAAALPHCDGMLATRPAHG